MKKSIKKHIIARILNNPCEASLEHLVRLNGVLYEREAYETCSVKELKKLYEPSLAYFNLVGEEFKIKNIDTITKILEDMKKLLIKRINIISQKENMTSIYELTSLLLALDCIVVNRRDLDIKGLIKNERIFICYDLAMLITDNSEGKETIKWFKRLKKLNFN